MHLRQEKGVNHLTSFYPPTNSTIIVITAIKGIREDKNTSE